MNSTSIDKQGLTIELEKNMGKLGGNTKLEVPIKFQTMNTAVINVEQEELNYLNGKENETFYEDCFSWKEISKHVGGCENICLPVNMQFILEENVNRPKCHNGSDHICMMKLAFNMV